MKIALISPIHHLDLMNEGDFLLVLPHLCKKSSKYFKFVKTSTKYKILDNGTAEFGKPINPKQLLKLGEEIKANEIVAPDVLYNGQKTLEMTEEFFKYIVAKNYDKLFNFMVVPQGNTFTEWQDCFRGLISYPVFNYTTTIGLSKFSVVSAFKHVTMCNEITANRQTALTYIRMFLKHSGFEQFRFQFHYLGMGSFQEITDNEGIVRSIDSAYPILLAKNGVYIRHSREPRPPTPSHYFFTKLSDGEKELAINNISVLKNPWS